MSVILYLEEEELSLVFKSIRYLKSFEPSSEIEDLHFRLRLLHGDLDQDTEETETEEIEEEEENVL